MCLQCVFVARQKHGDLGLEFMGWTTTACHEMLSVKIARTELQGLHKTQCSAGCYKLRAGAQIASACLLPFVGKASSR